MQGAGWMVLGEGSLLVLVFVRFGYYYSHSSLYHVLSTVVSPSASLEENNNYKLAADLQLLTPYLGQFL